MIGMPTNDTFFSHIHLSLYNSTSRRGPFLITDVTAAVTAGFKVAHLGVLRSGVDADLLLGK